MLFILIHYFRAYPVYKERWTQEMLSAIEKAYVPAETLANTRVYRPDDGTTPLGHDPGGVVQHVTDVRWQQIDSR